MNLMGWPFPISSSLLQKRLWSQYSVGFGHLRWLPEGPKHLVWKGWQIHEGSESRECAVGIGLELFGTWELRRPQFGE
jgi:hypothetical protein